MYVKIYTHILTKYTHLKTVLYYQLRYLKSTARHDSITVQYTILYSQQLTTIFP